MAHSVSLEVSSSFYTSMRNPMYDCKSYDEHELLPNNQHIILHSINLRCFNL